MKRGCPRHPKMAHLCKLLRIGLRDAVGLLELLWHFTAEFAPCGDIGKYDDERIAAAMDWRRGKPGRLIAALIESRWIDRHLGAPPWVSTTGTTMPIRRSERGSHEPV